MTVELSYVRLPCGIALLRYVIGLKNRATFSANQKQTTARHNLLARVFPRLTLITCICFPVVIGSLLCLPLLLEITETNLENCNPVALSCRH